MARYGEGVIPGIHLDSFFDVYALVLLLGQELQILEVLSHLIKGILHAVEPELNTSEVVHVGNQLDQIIPRSQGQQLVIAFLCVDYRLENFIVVAQLKSRNLTMEVCLDFVL